MTILKLGPGDYRTMPWKNGGGSTTELLIEPPGATLAGGFNWRVSMATVAESGPFSSFPGFDRTLMLLEGQGLELDHGPHRLALLPGPLVPVRFNGEWTTSGRLLGGPCLDFNVMTRREAVLQDVSILHLGPPAALPQVPVLLVFCCRGAAVLPSLGLELGSGELLRIDGGCAPGLMIEAAAGTAGTADLAVIAIRPRPEPG